MKLSLKYPTYASAPTQPMWMFYLSSAYVFGFNLSAAFGSLTNKQVFLMTALWCTGVLLSVLAKAQYEVMAEHSHECKYNH